MYPTSRIGVMKKVLWVISILIGLLWMTAVVLFVSTDIQILEPEEQQKLKAGKLFWEWHSTYGPLAMHYVEKGEGANHLLLLHGFRAHSYTWKALMTPLAEAGYHVWAIDLIGYGLSDKPDHAVYSIDFFVQQVNAFMEAKGITQAHMVGNSMGGGLALSLALAHPQQVRSLILLSALGYPLDMPLYLSLGRHINQIWAPFLGPTMVRHGLKQIVYNEKLVTDEQVEAYSLPYRFPGGVTASLLTLQKFDNQRLAEMGRQYASLSYPVLIIWGDHDTLIPIHHYEKFLKDFPHADKLLITHCGHIPQEEAPEQVLTAISAFLKKVDSPLHSLQKNQKVSKN
jgi:pimeloyl-ACP methyl ester carboxylesterase